MTADTAVAEDLTQEVFLQLFRKIASFRGDAALGTWLHRVAVNAVLMRFRKNKKRITYRSSRLGEKDRRRNSQSRHRCTRSDVIGLD